LEYQYQMLKLVNLAVIISKCFFMKSTAMKVHLKATYYCAQHEHTSHSDA